MNNVFTISSVTTLILSIIISHSCRKEEPSLSEYGTVTDIEGNVYKTIIIGSQTWMAENLKTAKYSNGDSIGTTTGELYSQGNPGWQFAYDDKESNVPTYGRLYTFSTLTDIRGICPTGWHVPSDAEWAKLSSYLGGDRAATNSLKETGTNHWVNSNKEATNESGFTAIPCGQRISWGGFDGLGTYTYWWSSTFSNTAGMAYAFYMGTSEKFSKKECDWYYAYSVRCMKGN